MVKSLVFFILFIPFVVSAHVTVKPTEVPVGAWQTFNVSVPVEKDMATIAVRLVIPEGVESVMPNVKPGWNIQTTKEGEGEDAVVKEITWTDGNVPAGMRDDFYFSAHMPATEGTLEWKAYQTYADGSVVSWDLNEAEQPKTIDGEVDFSSKGPYSETKVINDLKQASVNEEKYHKNEARHHGGRGALPLGLSLIALVMSGWTLYIVKRKKPQ